MGNQYNEREYNRFEDWRCGACGYNHTIKSQFPGMQHLPEEKKLELTCRRCGFKEKFATWNYYQAIE